MSRRYVPLYSNPRLRGRAFCEAASAEADEWLSGLVDEVVADHSGMALLAIGGYGRGELWPYSDLDLVLVHSSRPDIADIAEAIWYPIWDRNLRLGHTVVTPADIGPLIDREIDRATAFLSARLVAGDPGLVARFNGEVSLAWNRDPNQMLSRLAEAVRDRRVNFGDVAFKLEPDLKEGHGGLRDVHALTWAERAAPGFAVDYIEELKPYAETLLEARVELHRTVGRPGDVLALDDQDAVAEALGDDDGTDLMLRLSSASRRIAWFSEEAWHRHGRRRARETNPKPAVAITAKVSQVGGLIEINQGVDIDSDPMLLLSVAEASARTGDPIGRASLERLASSPARIPEPWSDRARELFTRIFSAGPSAIQVVEDLDQYDLMARLLPEWDQVMCLPQRNVFHTFTVDRHLCETAANACRLVDRVSRPDLLIIGALLHDIGKGRGGDHTEIGVKLIEKIAKRMGYEHDDVGVLVELCRLHLLLPDVATRRDISDPGTIRAVAAAVHTVEFLQMLAALTEADSLATGPSAWGSWKEGLVNQLVARTAAVLEGYGEPEEETEFPTSDQREVLARGERMIGARGNVLTIAEPNCDGLMAKGAGVLAMHGIDVLDAMSYTDEKGMAISRFVVQSSTGAPVEWPKVIEAANKALDGRLALSARISQRARNYARYQRRLSASPPRRFVAFDNVISDFATVVEVHAPDTIGLVYRMAYALTELNLEIRYAKIQTLGPDAVDSFYLCGPDGGKLDDPELHKEINLALTEAMGLED